MAIITKAALEQRVALLERLLGQALVVIEQQRVEMLALAAIQRALPKPQNGNKGVRPQVGPTHRLPSKYASTCRACGDDIEKGEWIAWSPRKAWHEDCVPYDVWITLPLLER